MPQWVWVSLVVAVGLVINLVVVLGMIGAIGRVAMRSLSGPYPMAEPQPDAVGGVCKQIVIGSSRLAGGMHRVMIDEGHLHLVPSRLSKRLGVPGASVPWEAFDATTLKPARTNMGQGMCEVKMMSGKRVIGPAWCFGLISPEGRSA